MNTLYHYGSNNACFSILEQKSIRMSDIRKSNDYNELLLFFPDIFDEILLQYKKDPFPFKYETEEGFPALSSLIQLTEDMLFREIQDGDFSNFVLCFSQEPDLLSQWRGYANDGKGIGLGFSLKVLQQKCQSSNGILTLEQVQYVDDKKWKELLHSFASEAIDNLKTLRQWIVENVTLDDTSSDTDSLLGFNFHGWMKSLLTDTLKYKKDGFKEEKEWRLFLADQAYKNPDWVLGSDIELTGPLGFSETISFLRNNIKFNIYEDTISSYIELNFAEFDDNLLTEVWLGPKSKITNTDMELFLATNKYSSVKIYRSHTSYR